MKTSLLFDLSILAFTVFVVGSLFASMPSRSETRGNVARILDNRARVPAGVTDVSTVAVVR